MQSASSTAGPRPHFLVRAAGYGASHAISAPGHALTGTGETENTEERAFAGARSHALGGVTRSSGLRIE